MVFSLDEEPSLEIGQLRVPGIEGRRDRDLSQTLVEAALGVGFQRQFTFVVRDA